MTPQIRWGVHGSGTSYVGNETEGFIPLENGSE